MLDNNEADVVLHDATDKENVAAKSVEHGDGDRAFRRSASVMAAARIDRRARASFTLAGLLIDVLGDDFNSLVGSKAVNPLPLRIP